MSRAGEERSTLTQSKFNPVTSQSPLLLMFLIHARLCHQVLKENRPYNTQYVREEKREE